LAPETRASAENFPGGGQRKDQKLAKSSEKYHDLAGSGGGGGATKKHRKIAKKGRKVAPLSLYLLYLYHV